MTEQIKHILERSYDGEKIIEYIEKLEIENKRLRTDNEMLTLERQTLTEQLRHVLDENKCLKQVVDADIKYVCVCSPTCRIKG